MAKKKSSKSSKSSTGRRRVPEDDPECYRVTINGPLKRALETAHSNMQDSRRYRRLASSSIHELAKEALDIGLQHLEEMLEQEARERE